jgi:hypothetical protein
MPADKVRRLEHLQNLLGADGRILRLCDFGKQHDEFIAAVPRERIRTAHAQHQAFAHRFEQPLAHHMSKGVVDVLEVVQIHEQNGRLFLVPARLLDRFDDLVVCENPRGEAGGRAMAGSTRPSTVSCGLSKERSTSWHLRVQHGGTPAFRTRRERDSRSHTHFVRLEMIQVLWGWGSNAEPIGIDRL